MPRSDHTWIRSLTRRGIVVLLTALALTAYGLVSAAGNQPLAFKPVAASVGDNSKLAVAMAVSPTNGSVNVVAQGPSHSLYFYWQVAGTWHGPLGLGGANTTYSAPSIAAEPNGNFDIAVQGPNNSLYFYWDASGTWYGPLAIGAPGSTFSTPSIVVEAAPSGPHNLDVVAQGANHALYQWWNTETDAMWHGPIASDGANSTFSAPSMSASYYTSSSVEYNELFVSNVGLNNDLIAHYYDQSAGKWQTTIASNDNTAFTAPSQMFSYSVFEGPNNSLYQAYGFDQIQFTELRGGGSTFSSPAEAGTGRYVATQGPSHTLYFYYSDTNNCGFFFGGCGQNVVQVGGIGSTYSAPAMTVESNGTIDFVAQGPNNTLRFYWDIGPGSYHGPLQIGGPGTTFTSPN